MNKALRILRSRLRWRVLAVLGACLAAALVFRALTGQRGSGNPVDALANAGDVAGLGRLAGAGDPALSASAVSALGAIDKARLDQQRLRQAADAVLKAVESPAPRVREEALLALARLTRRKHADRIAAKLKEDEHPYVRATAAAALGRIWSCEHVPDLIDAMNDKDKVVRAEAVRAAARICGMEPRFAEPDPAKNHKLLVNYYRVYWKGWGKRVTKWHYEDNKR